MRVDLSSPTIIFTYKKVKIALDLRTEIRYNMRMICRDGRRVFLAAKFTIYPQKVGKSARYSVA